MTNHAYIILGPPGSGKGTQAQEISKLLNLSHISTGDIFRSIVGQDSPFGQEVAQILKSGQLVSDDITNQLVANRLAEPDAVNGFVLDGYPRNINQAKYLNTLRPELTAIYFKLSDEAVVQRLSGRRTCPTCNRIYHIKYSPPKVEGVCDDDGSHLIQRTDDTEGIIRTRLQTYHQQTELILEFYQHLGKLIELDGTAPIPEVTAKLRVTLGI